jgi:CheY-like chemotaxis protein
MPGLVFFDLNMPRMDGFWMLRKMRAAERTRFIPVVIITSSVDPEDVRMAYTLGPTATSTSSLMGCHGTSWCGQWRATGWG